VAEVAKMALDGHGADTYRTFWLVDLITVAAAVVALMVALVFSWREEWRWRELERRYGTRDLD